MATYSQTDLATRILRDAGLIGADEVPEASDLNWAIETLSSEIDLMAAKGITIWNGSEFSIPSSYLTALSRRIVLAVGPAFGLSDSGQAAQAIPVVERDLRIISSKPATGAVAETDYF